MEEAMRLRVGQRDPGKQAHSTHKLYLAAVLTVSSARPIQELQEKVRLIAAMGPNVCAANLVGARDELATLKPANEI